MRIGQAAAHSGVSAANIRFYEQQGLLPAAPRQGNSYRSYSEADVHRLRFIRLCRGMDMSLDEVKSLLALDGARAEDCLAASATLQSHLGHVRERMQELRALESSLQQLLDHCHGEPAHAACGLIAALHAQADAVPEALSDAAPQHAVKRHV